MAYFPVAHAESSSAAGTHPFLRFADLPTSEKYQKLKNLEVFTISGIDWHRIGMVDPTGSLARLLPHNTPWRRFFDILEPSYDELVYEFLSTFYYQPNKNLTEVSIHFRLCGQPHNMSLSEFAVRLGIYTNEEVNQPIFTRALTSFSYMGMRKYWQHHTSKTWCSYNHSMNFEDPRYRYMHHVLANTITGRQIYQQRVRSTEVFYLYSIFEQVPCNIARELAAYFSSQQTGSLKSLMGGSYVTRIAKSLGSLSDQVIQGLSPSKAPGIVNCNNIKLTPTLGHAPTQLSQSEKASFILNSTPTQNLQQSWLQFPPPSFYRYDMLSQLSYTQEPITTNIFQPLASNVSQGLSPLVFEEAPMTQDELFDESMMLQEQLEPDSLLPQSFLALMNEVEQLPPTDVAGPSMVPQMDLHPDQMVVEMARLNNQNQELLRQVQELTERNQQLESLLAARMQLDPLPPLPDNFEPEIDPLHDVFQI